MTGKKSHRETRGYLPSRFARQGDNPSFSRFDFLPVIRPRHDNLYYPYSTKYKVLVLLVSLRLLNKLLHFDKKKNSKKQYILPGSHNEGHTGGAYHAHLTLCDPCVRVSHVALCILQSSETKKQRRYGSFETDEGGFLTNTD